MKKFLQDCTAIKNLILLCGLLLITGSAWADTPTTYYAALKAKLSSSSNGMGTVYAGTSNTEGTYGAESTSGNQSSTTQNEGKQFYAFAKANEGYSFTGWSNSDGGSIVSTENPYKVSVSCSSSNSSSPTTTTVFANFIHNEALGITFMPGTNGSYTVNGTKITTAGGQTITCEGAASLVATAASGYKFFGWYTSMDGGNSRSYISYSANASYTFQSATTVYADFIPSSTAVFIRDKNESVHYKSLTDALSGFSSGSICVFESGTVSAGNYTIPSGVTLLVPYDNAYTLKTTEPAYENNDNNVKTRVLFRQLTLASGVNITINGSMSVGANLHARNGGQMTSCVLDNYGRLQLESGSNVTLNGNLYCWGFITGSGSIIAMSGSKVYEPFQMDFRGGTHCSNTYQSAFPMCQYYVQNIEAPITFHNGATETLFTCCYANYSLQKGTASFIGSSGLFRLESGSTLTRHYDGVSDRQCYDLYGNASIQDISVSVSVMKLASKSYILPINNNMTLTVHSGTTAIYYDLALLPDSRIIIDDGATVEIKKNIYIYDKSDWRADETGYTYIDSKNKTQKSYFAVGADINLVPYSPTKTGSRTSAGLTDAHVVVNGTLKTLSSNGKIYTTTHGADICSDGGGKIVYGVVPTSTSSFKQGISTASKVQDIPVTSAQLHNSTAFKNTYGADFEYLATAGTAANTTINYANGHWGWVEVWKNGETVLAATNTVAKVNNASAKDALLSGLASVGYNASWADAVEDDTKQEVTHAVVLTPQEYTITYKDKGDAAFSGVHGSGYPTKHTYNTATTLVSPTKAGYNFGGWYSSSDCSGNAVTSLGATAYTANITLYAKWTPKQYTITFDSKGGSAVASITKDYGASVTAPANPTREGYTFNGWNPAVPSTMPLNGLTCVAQWKQLYTITWVVDGVEMKSEQIAEGEMPDYGETPTKGSTAQYEYSFTGWEPEIHAVNGDQTYSGSFNAAIRYYEVKFVNDNGGELQSSLVEYGRTPTFTGKTPTSTKTDGIYQFTGWSPAIAPIGEAVTYTAQYTKLMALTVDEGETLNVGITTEVTTTTVHVAGQLNVASETTLTTTDLILEATPSRSGEIKGAGSVTATNAYFHFSQEGGFKARTWYAVAVPWQVNVPAYDKEHNGVYIKTGNGEFVQQELGSTFDLIYYDGYRRSQGATKAWNYVEDDQPANQVMYPGRAYMIYLTADADTIRFKKNSETLLYTNVDVATYPQKNGLNGTYADWNGIANPAIYKAYLNVGATKDKGQIYNPDTKQYEWFDMKNNQLQVGQPIFVQSTVSGTILANANEYASSSLAPRRAKESVKPITDYELMLAASDADVSDRIIVSTDEDKEADEYIVGQDLAKMGVSSVVAQMWIDRYDSKMCINTVAPINNTADYPLGISVQKDGEYDLFIDDQPNDETMLYLTYDGEAIWNLSYGGYVATLTKGTNTHYGLRIVYAERRTPTGIEEATIQNGESIRKVLVDDKVFIIRGNNVYSIDGQLVK